MVVCLQHTLITSIYQPSSPPQVALRKNGSFRDRLSVMVKAEQVSPEPSSVSSQDALSRRTILAVGTTINLAYLSQATVSFAAESKKGFIPVMDKKDAYMFYYPFGWQEVAIEGQDKVFKDVIEPLESVSVNLIPTNKQNIRDFGPPQEVAETLIKKVLAPPNQKTKLIEAKEIKNQANQKTMSIFVKNKKLYHDQQQEVDGTTYYTFEFVTQARNYTRHALSTVCIGNGKFYTLTTGANERRWDKMKERLYTVVDSFRVNV